MISLSSQWPSSVLGYLAVPLTAFIGALLTVFIVYSLARIGNTLPVTNLILAGVAVSSFATALTSFLMINASGELRRSLVWLLGGSNLSGWKPLIGQLPYVLIGLAALLGSADIIIHLWVPEPKPMGLGPSAHLGIRLLKPFANRDFLWLTLAMGVWAFSCGMVGQFGFIYLNRAFNVSYSAMSMLAISAVIGASMAGIMWSYVMDRVGARNFGAIMMIVAPLAGVAWFFLRDADVLIPIPFFQDIPIHQPMLVLLIANVFAGLFYSGVGLSQISLLSALAPVEGRTLAMGIHWAGVGLLGATGPLFGGWVMDRLEAYVAGPIRFGSCRQAPLLVSFMP